MKSSCIAIVLFLSITMLAPSAIALDFPRGPVILTLSGMINRTNAAGNAVLDAAVLKSLPQITIVTDTPWTEGQIRFEGPLLRDVLELVGADGKSLRAIAINDYFVEIPATDAEMYDVILAMRLNDSDLNVRSKGPLWVIYPWKDNENLRSETYYSRSIWQLMRIDVQ